MKEDKKLAEKIRQLNRSQVYNTGKLPTIEQIESVITSHNKERGGGLTKFLERKIQGCDELGNMPKEKWAFKQCLKFIREDSKSANPPKSTVSSMSHKTDSVSEVKGNDTQGFKKE